MRPVIAGFAKLSADPRILHRRYLAPTISREKLRFPIRAGPAVGAVYALPDHHHALLARLTAIVIVGLGTVPEGNDSNDDQRDGGQESAMFPGRADDAFSAIRARLTPGRPR